MRSTHLVLAPVAALVLVGCNELTGIAPPAGQPRVDQPADTSVDYGTWLSMDVAPDGERLCMAYYDKEFGGLGFAVGVPDADGEVAWLHEQVDGYSDASSGLDTGDIGTYASMKVGPDGTVWIASYDAKGTLKYAHRPGGGAATFSRGTWNTGIIDAGPGVGTWASLDLDAEGNPVVAYHDEANGTLKVARIDATTIGQDAYTWTTTVAYQGQPFSGPDEGGNPVVRPADVGEMARLVIEGGTEFIAFYDKAQQQLGFVEGVGGAYSGALVSPTGLHQGQWPSILVDAGTVLVAHHDVGNQSLILSTRQQGGWLHETVDNAPFVGADTEIFKRGGKVSILYFDGQNVDQKLATREGQVWVAENVGGEGTPVGFHNEAVRLTDAWWIGSYDYLANVPQPIRLADAGGE